MIFEKIFARNYEKIIILGTSDAWMTSHLSVNQLTSLLYCRLSDLYSDILACLGTLGSLEFRNYLNALCRRWHFPTLFVCDIHN